jgi:hypothetical protein
MPLLSGAAAADESLRLTRRLDGDDVSCFGTFRPVERVELHLRAPGERLETLAHFTVPVAITNTSSTTERTGRGSASRANRYSLGFGSHRSTANQPALGLAPSPE